MATAQRTPPPTAPAATEARPRLAPGVELVGEYLDSGFKTPPWLLRRADGQVVQVPRLLYLVAESADGRRTLTEIAEHVSHAMRRGVTAEMVGILVEERLRPLGVTAGADGSSPPAPKADPLLALKFRTAVVPERLTRALTRLFLPLFAAPVVVLVVAALGAVDVWLLGIHGISPALRGVIYHPILLLLLIAGVAVATAFHEIGHATACRYGGAKPGVMGVGIYIVWPAFYTDVTDAYRLDKRGRLRTDLGGVYFNAIFALVAAGAYAVTGLEPILLLVLIQNFAIVQQLLPLVRLDGYYIISDLTGVPDMFSRIRPVLTSVLPWRRASDKVEELKPWVRRVVTGYILLIVPLLVVSFALMALHAPRAFATAYDSLGVQWDKTVRAPSLPAGMVGGLQLLMLVLPCAGMVLTGGRVSRRLTGAAWGWSAGSPPRRALVTVVVGGTVALVGFTWWPNGDYRPIQPGERGTIGGALRSVLNIPSGRPSLSAARAAELHGAPFERDRLRRHRAEQGARSDAPQRDSRPTPDGSATDTSGDQSPTGSESATDGGASPAPGSTPTATSSPAGTATPAATATPAPTSTASPTTSPSPTATATATATATVAPSATASQTTSPLPPIPTVTPSTTTPPLP